MDIPSKAICPFALLRPGETAASPRVLKSVSPFITNLLHVLCEWDEKLLPNNQAITGLVERYREYEESLPSERRHLILHEGHLVYTRPEEESYLTPEIAQTAAMIGEPDEIIERIRALEKSGLSHFAFQVTDDPIIQIKTFPDTIIARY